MSITLVMASKVECPVCGIVFASSVISAHVNCCLNDHEDDDKASNSDSGASARKRTSDHDAHAPPSKILKTGEKISSHRFFDAFKSIKTDSLKTKPIDCVIQPIDCDDLDDLPDSLVENSKIAESPKINKDTKFKKGGHGNNVVPMGKSNAMTPGKQKKDNSTTQRSSAPLAAQMRPQSLEDFVGQYKAIKKKSLLYNIISETENVPSMIFWGPPGCGKTTLARIVGNRCKNKGNFRFKILSAVTASVGDVKQLATAAANDMKMFRCRTVLFLDEIHRFNKLQQDSLLPHVEEGTLILMGATTENPSFHVNAALLSRCRVIVLEKLSADEIMTILKRAIAHLGITVKTTAGKNGELNSDPSRKITAPTDGKDEEVNSDPLEETSTPSTSYRSGNASQVTITEEALDALAGLSDGDARSALNGLQLACDGCLSSLQNLQNNDGSRTEEDHDTGSTVVSVEVVKEALQRSHVLYDKNGEEHYNIASAMIKSLRGSDVDAALYWMVRMLEGGENPLFVARRLVVFASEDIGLADSTALSHAVAAYQACQLIGMPECAINLSHCVLYLARAPKSNLAITALHAARDCIRQHQGPLPPVPLHLRNASTKLVSQLGYGKNYKYPPNNQDCTDQEYMPTSLKGVRFVQQ